MPRLDTLWDELYKVWQAEVISKGGALNVLLMKDDEGNIHWLALTLFIFWPICSIIIFYNIVRSTYDSCKDSEELVEQPN